MERHLRTGWPPTFNSDTLWQLGRTDSSDSVLRECIKRAEGKWERWLINLIKTEIWSYFVLKAGENGYITNITVHIFK